MSIRRTSTLVSASLLALTTAAFAKPPGLNMGLDGSLPGGGARFSMMNVYVPASLAKQVLHRTLPPNTALVKTYVSADDQKPFFAGQNALTMYVGQDVPRLHANGTVTTKSQNRLVPMTRGGNGTFGGAYYTVIPANATSTSSVTHVRVALTNGDGKQSEGAVLPNGSTVSWVSDYGKNIPMTP